MNPLKTLSDLRSLEAAWTELLPAFCFISCGEIRDSYPPLSKIEKKSFSNDIKQPRLIELEAGRYHAKQILAKLKIIDLDLPKAKSSGSPKWPNNIKGSITHTSIDHFSHIAAVATNSKYINSIGIDAEFFLDLSPNIWHTFVTPDELNWLFTVSPDIRLSMAKKIWCMKEAAIKAYGHGDMMSFSVYPNTSSNFTEFKLINLESTKSKTMIGKATEVDKLTLATVYTLAPLLAI